MSKSSSISIVPQKNEFDDEFLNVVGTQFKFDHAKGLAEWIKNSVDAYAREDIEDTEQFVFLRFQIGNPKRFSKFECLDFVGVDSDHIDDAFKIWGKRTAAKGGKDIQTYGGHGNGGKFYMRQMFERSTFYTFRGGKMNIFGFDKNKKYGYAKDGKNRKVSLEEALKIAGVDHVTIPSEVHARWKKSKASAGFTVVRGEYPEKFSGRASLDTLLQKLIVHPQARRLFTRKKVMVLTGDSASGVPMNPPLIPPKVGFENAREIPLPGMLLVNGEEYMLGSKSKPAGKLVLKTSEQPLARSSELGDMNGVEIMGNLSCIGSYKMHELGILSAQADFIYGECSASFLEDEDCVSNDREKLVKNDLTDALLAWIKKQVEILAAELGEVEQRDRQQRNLKESALFNKILDKWKNNFMSKLSAEFFGGAGFGGGSGGSGTGGEGPGTLEPSVPEHIEHPEEPPMPMPPNSTHTHFQPEPEGEAKGPGDEPGNNEGNSDGSSGGGGSGTRKQTGSRFPRVLLSSYDPDPLSETGSVLHVDSRQPPIYQRDQDVPAGIFWINTSRPMAEKIVTQYTVKSTRWRDYLFQRYVEIIIKMRILDLAKREPDITADKIDIVIDKTTALIHDAAAKDLEDFLFNESMTGSAASAGEPLNETKIQQMPAADEVAEEAPSLGQMLASGEL